MSNNIKQQYHLSKEKALNLLTQYAEFNNRRLICSQITESGGNVKFFEKWFAGELKRNGLYVPKFLGGGE